MTSIYLERYAWQQALFPGFTPSEDLGMIVVLPAYKEPQIEIALEALNNCSFPSKDILILILINEPKDVEHEVQRLP